MALKSFGYFSSSVRHVVSVDRGALWKGRPEKSLLTSLSSASGRNNGGRITARRKGGGAKKRYRVIDFLRSARIGLKAEVLRIEYDPNRTAFIALLKYGDGDLSYILAPDGVKAGDVVACGKLSEIGLHSGNALLLSDIPVGTLVHNIELKPGKGGQMARSAGVAAQVVGRDSSVGVFAQLLAL